MIFVIGEIYITHILKKDRIWVRVYNAPIPVNYLFIKRRFKQNYTNPNPNFKLARVIDI